MREYAAFLILWLGGVCLAVWLEMRSGWRLGAAGASFLPGVVWWTLHVARMRELAWMGLLLVPLSGVFWPGTVHGGSAALGLAIAAALVPVGLVTWRDPQRRAPLACWRVFAGSGFIAAFSLIAVWTIESARGYRLGVPGASEAFGWALSAVGGGLLALTLLALGGFVGLAGSRHASTDFRLDAEGYRERVVGGEPETLA